MINAALRLLPQSGVRFCGAEKKEFRGISRKIPGRKCFTLGKSCGIMTVIPNERFSGGKL